MRRLYAFPLSPYCRKVRLALAEKGLSVDLIEIRPWDRAHELVSKNPAAETPVLVEEDGTVVVDSGAICEYLEEVYPDHPLLPRHAAERAEVRRLVAWFDVKFRADVTENILTEKVIRRLKRDGEPDSAFIRVGAANLRNHLEYIAMLADQRNWLAGSALTLADFAAAGHLSCLDYMGAVKWDEFPSAKHWYQRIKSRPAFRAILSDHLPGLPPAAHYGDLDF